VTCHDIFRDTRIEPGKTSESLPESGNDFFLMIQQLRVDVDFLIFWGFEVTLSHTKFRYHSSRRVISPKQRPLPDNAQKSQQTNFHAHGGIRKRNPSRWTTENRALDRVTIGIVNGNSYQSIHWMINTKQCTLH